jgi:two-component system cell cycle response regulator
MLFARLRALLRVKQVLDAWQLRAETARDLGFEPPDSPSLDIRGARALLVGETEPEREAIRAGLADDGVVVVAAAGEAEAWPVLLDPAQDLVLLNLGLSGGDALRLASRLRATVATRDLPVILIAGADQHAQVLRGFDIGANDHLLRPVDPNELRARARNQIRRKRYQERLRADLDRSLELAVTDPLTGLRNRRYVRRHLDAATRAGGAAVLLIDIDRFKPINDLHGHAAGDAALREVADRLRRHVRAADVVARYGGEEFLVVMAGALVEEAEGVAERLRLAIAEEPVDIGSARLRVTISIGIAVARPGEGTDSVVTAADSALYRAKRGGRDRVEIAVQA